MYKLFITLRYLRSRKISFFAVAGVAVGVMTLIVVLSVMNGFDQELRSRIRGTLTHIIITKGGMYGLENYAQVMEKVKERNLYILKELIQLMRQLLAILRLFYPLSGKNPKIYKKLMEKTKPLAHFVA